MSCEVIKHKNIKIYEKYFAFDNYKHKLSVKLVHKKLYKSLLVIHDI